MIATLSQCSKERRDKKHLKNIHYGCALFNFQLFGNFYLKKKKLLTAKYSTYLPKKITSKDSLIIADIENKLQNEYWPLVWIMLE